MYGHERGDKGEPTLSIFATTMAMNFECWAIIALDTRQAWAKQYYEIGNFLVKSKNLRTYGCACNVLHEFIFFIISIASFFFATLLIISALKLSSNAHTAQAQCYTHSHVFMWYSSWSSFWRFFLLLHLPLTRHLVGLLS